MFDRARAHRVDGRFAVWVLLRMRQMLLCLLTVGLAASSLAQEPRTVRVGVYQNSPKLDYTAAGKAEGIFIDIIEAIAEKEGWKIVSVPGTWVEGLVRLKTGEVDLMPDTALTEEREASYAYHHEPVLSQWNQIYTRRSSGIRRLIDLNGKRVASPRLPPALEIALFRVAQEAIVNALKHAGATRITVTLQTQSDLAIMIIADDGVGFDMSVSRPQVTAHLGLVKMRVRAQSIGGDLRIESAPESGTRVIVQVPHTLTTNRA